MYIDKLEWLDKETKEAVVKVGSGKDFLTCFSCPCSYGEGDKLTEPLECLDSDSFVVCDETADCIKKTDGVFGYQLRGTVVNREQGIVAVCGFVLQTEGEKIPKDITNGMRVQFMVSRIDVW